MKASYRWEDLTWEEIGEWAKQDAVVVVPVGSVEQHSTHLPVQTDSRIVSEIAERAVKLAVETTPVLLAPTISIDCSKHHMEFPGTLTLSGETFVRAVTEIGLSIVHHGFRKLFLLNGHGGNTAPLQIVANEIRHQTAGKAMCVTAPYWNFIKDQVQRLRKSQAGGISHAGEFETALIMALDESLVRTDKICKFLPHWSNRYFMPGWYVDSKVTLGFHLKDFTKFGVVGDPTVATKESGEQFLSAAVEAVSAFIESFAKWEFSNLYEESGGRG